MVRISPYQLFSLMVLFQLGTTVIFGFASGAGRDAWISVLISTLLGLAIMTVYLAIHRLNGGLGLAEWYPALFGKWLGTFVAWLYPILFIYDAGRIVGDIRFLFPISILPGTPDWAIAVTFMMIVVYVLTSGIEVLARVCSILFPIMLLFVTLEALMLGASGSLNLHLLKPFVAEGWGPVMGAVWPLGITQTFGESISFALIWSYVKGNGKGTGCSRVVLAATLFSGILISFVDVLAISGLGEWTFKQMMYPSFALLKLPSVADFLENLDALGVIYMMVNAFVKLSFHLFSAVILIRQLTGAKSEKKIAYPVAIAALFMGMTMVRGFSAHLEVAEKPLPYQFWVPLFLVLPAIALAVTGIKKIVKGKGASS